MHGRCSLSGARRGAWEGQHSRIRECLGFGIPGGLIIWWTPGGCLIVCDPPPSLKVGPMLKQEH
eukprot:5734172-Alexandrium_andersonii.AAC.1